jgi:hypothetical protein
LFWASAAHTHESRKQQQSSTQKALSQFLTVCSADSKQGYYAKSGSIPSLPIAATSSIAKAKQPPDGASMPP